MNKIDLYKGDCLDVMDELIAKGITVDAIITDPPYNTTACAWDFLIPFNNHLMLPISKRSKKLQPIYRDEYILRELKNGREYKEICDYFDKNSKDGMWQKINKLIKHNGAIVLFGSEPFSSALRMSNIKNYKYDWYWRKNKKTNFANSKRQPLRDTECVSVFCKRQSVYNPQGIIKIDKKVTRNKPKNETINAGENDGSLCGDYTQEFTGYPSHSIEFKSQTKTVHPTQKPVALMGYLIKTYTNEGELVLDFTMGSGTTILAAKNLNRRGIGIEMDDTYFNIAKKRIEDTVVEKGLFDE